MATIAPGTKSEVSLERGFFLKMAFAMTFVLVAGFSFNVAAGRSTFDAPLLIHAHAFTFFGWVVLYVTQAILVTGGSVQLHQRLGIAALLLVPLMVVLGIVTTVYVLQAKGGPPFFDMNEFLFANSLGILAFAVIVLLALRMRTRSDWHKRLMFCAMASLTGPGLGRLLPMPFLIPWGWWIASVALPMTFVLIGILRDARRRGRIHSAWFLGAGIFIASQLLASVIAYSPMGIEYTRDLVAGTAGAQRQMEAFFP